ncbi:anaerobic sulfite reductase subunit AsrB [Oceanirhabdus sp. W0125-5]|uniref:anaerobic sulfite reductase subunit AsrB n=1 Tax=Oceanirhabdus sp. W0125-5 TaxID=2999116 RepID=UPI0022F2BA0F|nr:anaerobic sulfite reductase subunit AsrB [Oceanirhabdus sp. W0125-5]WBW96107.1 anaerobic sulfite reductase subunit AsrB [Oceanirhabdus sp. W0125-5]
MKNVYMPFKSEILDIIQHTDIEYTFRMAYKGDVKPGQFFEVSIPKYGECPISVSGIGEDYLDFTIRRVGKVTDELHKFKVGDGFWLRGPYGNGFDVNLYKGKEVIIAAGGSGLAPVKGIIDIIYETQKEYKDFNLLVGFKSPQDILFKKELKVWEEKMNVTLTVDGAEDGYEGNVGLITKYVEGVKVANKSNTAVIIVGPPMMMKFTVNTFLDAGIPEENIWVSYERKMHCGIGKCGHCKMDDTYICLEGPVFNFTKAKQLFD